MAGFAAADAAFTGFRVVWEKPWAVVIWAAVQFVASLGFELFTAATAGPAYSQIAHAGLIPNDPQRMMALFEPAAPTYVATLIAQLVLVAVFYAAMNRAVMRPAEGRFGYLRLASDELRQLALLVILLLLALAFYLAVLIVASIVVGVIGALGGASGAGVVGVLLAVMLPLLVCVFIFFGVRLSLASPLTFASGHINVFGSWAMTRRRFWSLFGAYFIAFALSLVVLALTFAIAVIGVIIIDGNAQAAGPAFTVASVLAPSRLVYLAVVSIGAALSAPITMCPPAAIYQAMTGGAPAVARAFD